MKLISILGLATLAFTQQALSSTMLEENNKEKVTQTMSQEVALKTIELDLKGSPQILQAPVYEEDSIYGVHGVFSKAYPGYYNSKRLTKCKGWSSCSALKKFGKEVSFTYDFDKHLFKVSGLTLSMIEKLDNYKVSEGGLKTFTIKTSFRPFTNPMESGYEQSYTHTFLISIGNDGSVDVKNKGYTFAEYR